MKISLNWIKDYVQIPADLDLSRLSYDLTMSTVEVEGSVKLADKFNNMVVGVVEEVLQHPDADKLRICKTNIGNGDIRDVVCGGTNLRNGMKVALAMPGSLVRWHGEGELVEIKIAKLRGVESFGMICSSSEIGLFDLFPYEEEGTIIDLSDFELSAGTPLAEALGIDDIILEIDNKSLTNRPDLWGHYGIAREISALYDLPFNEVKPYEPKCTTEIKIDIKDSDRCPRYIGVKMEGFNVEPSPFNIQKRLWSVGARPINSIVDVTNYVMLAVGQPTHAFDSDHIKDSIIVRTADSGEKLGLLDGKSLSLTTHDLVIADSTGPVALAGVMGGEKDSILPETKKVILEIANFEPIGVRRTAARYETRTESAIRYEKGIDPERCELALSVVMELFAGLFPNLSVVGFKDNYPNKLERKIIDVSLSWLERRLGKKIANKDIEIMIKRLGFEVKFSGDNMNVIAPTWRSTGDISIEEDVLEEVARMHGFENFEPMPITTSFTGVINQLDVDLDRRIKEYLAYRCGMQEIFSYPWVNNEYLNAIFPSTDGMLKISAPPSSDECYLRTSHIPNMCKAIVGNLRYMNEFSLFESAQVFFDKDYRNDYDEKESLPLSRKNITGAIVGNSKDIDSLFRRAKGIIEALPRMVHVEALSLERKEKPSWADETVWLNICSNGDIIGNIALLSRKATLASGIKNSVVVLFEIFVDGLQVLLSRTNKFEPLPEYPMTEYDLSILLDASVKWEEVRDAITSKKSEILRDVSFVDEYRGQQVPEGKKSLTLRMIIGSLEKTLTSEEIESYANSVVKNLSKILGAELRR